MTNAINNYKQTIYSECMMPHGFAAQIRENTVDIIAFRRLIDAVHNYGKEISDDISIDRLTIACLFELPWEIENTVPHYTKQSKALGKDVSKMADELRENINELLWTGLETHYQDV